MVLMNFMSGGKKQKHMSRKKSDDFKLLQIYYRTKLVVFCQLIYLYIQRFLVSHLLTSMNCWKFSPKIRSILGILGEKERERERERGGEKIHAVFFFETSVR